MEQGGPKHRHTTRRLAYLAIAVLATGVAVQLGGCYYMQAVGGQLDLLKRREPITDVLADPALSAEARRKLELVVEARQFASDELGLPDNKSYQSYADLERDYVVWNVFAAGEFELTPVTWCFPVVGCVAYRGYFAEEAAKKYASRLEDKGYDVRVSGVPAYSTLGRFDDPVLNTMLGWSDAGLISTLFHELAHQRLFIKNDTTFNESFATAVEEAGLERWLERRPDSIDLERHRAGRQYRAEQTALAEAAKRDLAAIYASGLDVDAMRAAKAERLQALTDAARALARDRGFAPGGWLSPPLNNASLLPVSLYRGRLDAFRALLAECGQNLECFYTRCEELGQLEPDERHAALDALERSLQASAKPRRVN